VNILDAANIFSYAFLANHEQKPRNISNDFLEIRHVCSPFVRLVAWRIGMQISADDMLVIKPHGAFNLLMLAVLTFICPWRQSFPVLSERSVSLRLFFFLMRCAVAKQRVVPFYVTHRKSLFSLPLPLCSGTSG
jgi:hypothetical protein